MFDESRALHGILQTASLKPKAEAAARFQPIVELKLLDMRWTQFIVSAF